MLSLENCPEKFKCEDLKANGQDARDVFLTSIANDISQSFGPEIFETNGSCEEINAFHSRPCDPLSGLDQYSAEKHNSSQIDASTVDKISLKSCEGPENGILIEDKHLSHLNCKDRGTVSKLVNKFPDFWSTHKHQIGRFRGFKASIDLIEGASAYSKQRKTSRNLEDGVRNTMEGLEKSGVFGPSTGESSRFCSNMNIVSKLESGDEIRLLSKADKHVARMQQGAASTASGFRAAFDYKNLNSQLKDVGKLSLPTLGEVEQAIKNCHVSSLDLKISSFQ